LNSVALSGAAAAMFGAGVLTEVSTEDVHQGPVTITNGMWYFRRHSNRHSVST
jgi:hypothetical protein